MKNKKGLTLVEVVVALAVFMIAVVMAYPIITRAGTTNIHSQNKMDIQETGNYVAENLSKVASKEVSRDELVERLQNFGVCSQKSDPCPEGDDVGSFSRVSDTLIFNATNNAKHKIEISLNEDDNLARIIVETKNIEYEVVEWLKYDE